ncbi:hypothetical protein BDP55DRAFT_54483 [Colletotrichum godetiae]|uniref:Uncharacterized protein n=1 Tax=Colletotrichum godetiae TaxID=1209918 RepID=A0AAJ0A5L5_9PEZI|nr:uncharacterized protein BDP55DRAFT_54483 [Colletotrichum godetiae]KAK1656931.1 hypothetical protein BDP55DRAFT_54483 [Colletotrichum godetiae]
MLFQSPMFSTPFPFSQFPILLLSRFPVFLFSCFPALFVCFDPPRPYPAFVVQADMEKYIESLLNVINHFHTHNSPSPKHVRKFRSSIGLFPEDGRESDDPSSTRSKRKGACVFLTKVHEDLGFRMSLLCAFTFGPTTLYEIGQLSSFIDEMKDKITGLLQAVAVNFGANIKSYKTELKAKIGANDR